MSSDVAYAVAVDRRGRTTPLGEFVFGLLRDSGQSISEVSRRSDLSRSFLYLLRDDRQVPSIDTLVALFEAIGVDDVRLADAHERGELAITTQGHEFWIRLPPSNKRAARSRSTYESLTGGAVASAAPSVGMSGSADDELFGSAPRRPSSRATRYDRDTSFARARTPESRQQLLAELLAAAGDLDPKRLELLVEHARLLGRDD